MNFENPESWAIEIKHPKSVNCIVQIYIINVNFFLTSHHFLNLKLIQTLTEIYNFNTSITANDNTGFLKSCRFKIHKVAFCPSREILPNNFCLKE